MKGRPVAWMGMADAHTVRVCCYCPDKDEADRLAVSLGYGITHGACEACERIEMGKLVALPLPAAATAGAFVTVGVIAEVCGISEAVLAKEWPKDMRIGRDWRRSGEVIEVAEHALSFVVAALATGGEPEAARRLLEWVTPSAPPNFTAGCSAPEGESEARFAHRTSTVPARELSPLNWAQQWEEKQ